MGFLLAAEILVLALVIVALFLDFRFPCDSRVKILLALVVFVKIVLIVYISRRKGEQKGYAKCERQMDGVFKAKKNN
jgi:hypothetical protein